MKKVLKTLHPRHTKLIVVSGLFLITALVVYCVFRNTPARMTLGPLVTVVEPPPSKPIPVPVAPRFPQSHTDIRYDTAYVAAVSKPVFAYPHGVTIGDGKFFIGMANQAGNTFPTNDITVFPDPNNLALYSTIALKDSGGVEDMTYDAGTDKVYFILSDNRRLELYSLDPHSYALRTIISTTTIDAGNRPAIATDGSYIYGITNTTPATVFKVGIADGSLEYNSTGHIRNGHSAAIGTYPRSDGSGTTTELYFGGGVADGFEKTDATTLQSLAKIDLGPCSLGNDEAYVPESSGSNLDSESDSGFVFVGCEMHPYGYRIRTSDMSVTQFPLPGNSFGLFAYGNNLYNAAQDDTLDIFPGFNLNDLRRYVVVNTVAPVDTHNQSMELNKVFYDEKSGSLYFTAWYGVPGIFKIAPIPNM